MKRSRIDALIIVCLFTSCLAIMGYMYWFNNFRPARITSEEAYNIALNYLSSNQLRGYNITQITQGTWGPTPFYYHIWRAFCSHGSRDGMYIIIDAYDGNIIDVLHPIFD